MKIKVGDIKKLRNQTGVGIMDARKALQESNGNAKTALQWLKRNAVKKAAKKAGRSTSDGIITAYVHQTGKIASLVKLGCETDFVARTDDFQKLGKEIAMQVASMNPKNIRELSSQVWIRDPKTTISGIIQEHIAKLGENIIILDFVRFAL